MIATMVIPNKNATGQIYGNTGGLNGIRFWE